MKRGVRLSYVPTIPTGKMNPKVLRSSVVLRIEEED